MTDVYLELGKKLVFAGAILWPGWSRSGKTEEAALEKLAATAPRYAVIAETARVPFDVETAGNFKVVELLKGTAATDFGVPEMIANSDRAPLKGRDAQRFRGAAAGLMDGFRALGPRTRRPRFAKGRAVAGVTGTRSLSTSPVPKTCTRERSVFGSMTLTPDATPCSSHPAGLSGPSGEGLANPLCGATHRLARRRPHVGNRRPQPVVASHTHSR